METITTSRTERGYDVERFTDTDTGAWVELHHDDDPMHPFEGAEGIAIAFRERDHYSGTADAIPSDMIADCPLCKGYGELPDEYDRWELRRDVGTYFDSVVGVGSYECMSYECDRTEGTYIERAACHKCKGSGSI